MGYNYKTGHLSGQTQAIIRQREENERISRESAQRVKEQKEAEQLKEINKNEDESNDE